MPNLQLPGEATIEADRQLYVDLPPSYFPQLLP